MFFQLQLIDLWDKGIFLENHITKTEKINCYAIDMFFVEVVYDAKENKITEVSIVGLPAVIPKNNLLQT
jgi:hypothetical protein